MPRPWLARSTCAPRWQSLTPRSLLNSLARETTRKRRKKRHPSRKLRNSQRKRRKKRKRFYSNNDEPESVAWFWEHFDHENYSIWRGDYKYNDELTMVFMSCNLIGGMFQRLDKLNKNAFAS